MKIRQAAVLAALIQTPVLAIGQDTGDGDEAIDEIVVAGRAVSTSSMRIAVEREMLVDSATALKEIPGANVNANGAITGIAQYRGMYGDRIAVNVDNLGVTSGGPNAMDAPLSYLSPMIADDLSVERGIARVSSAPESIGGAINSTLDRGSFGGDKMGISGSLGTRYAGNGDVSTSFGRLTASNSGHRVSLITEIDQGNNLSTPVGKIRPSQLDRERYDLSYGFSGAGTELLLFAGALDTTDTGTPALPMDIRFIKTDLFGLRLTQEITQSVSVEARVGYNDVEHLMDNFTLREAPLPMRQRQNLATGTGSHFYVAGMFDLGESQVTVGVDGSLADHDSVITNPNMAMFRVDNLSDVERNVVGLFAEWDRQFGRSHLDIGLRYKQVDTDAGSVAALGMPPPMAGNVQILADAFNSSVRDKSWSAIDAVVKFRREMSDNSDWIIELGSKTRAPSYQELYLWLPLQATGGLADGRTYIGDLDLEQERSNEIVTGFTTGVGPLSLSPQVFFRQIDNYIQGTPSTNMTANMVSMMMSGQPALQFSNVEAEIWGADLAWKVELSDRWFVDGIASYSRGRRTDEKDDLYRLAPLNGSLGLTYRADTWSIKPEVVIYASQDNVSAFNNEQPTGGYELVNIGFTWQPIDSLRVEARVDNLLDETYQDHLVGINRALGSDIPPGERLYGLERTLRAGLILSF